MSQCATKLHVRMGIRISFFSARVVLQWHRLPREEGESPSLKVFKKCGDWVLKGMVYWA